MNADYRAGVRRGLGEAIVMIEMEEAKWRPGAQPVSYVARTRQARAVRLKSLTSMKRRIFALLRAREQQDYGRGDPYVGEAVLLP